MQLNFLKRIALLTAVLVALLAAVPAGAQASASAVPAPPFADVLGTRYQDAVGALYALGVVTGLDARTFGPNQPVTRAQFVAMAMRAMNIKPSAADVSGAFSDVAPAYWAAPLIGRAVAMGLVTGDRGRFRPEDPVTFAEAATVILRAAGYETPEMRANWPVAYVLKARELGLLQDTQFTAGQVASRGEIALMIANWIFRVPMAATGQTLSQSTFQVVADLKILPESELLDSRSLTLSAQGVDWFGNAFPVTPTWRVTTGNASITPAGLLTVTGVGPITVEATAGAALAQRTFRQVTALQISAGAPQGPNGAVQMQATGIRDDGVKVDLPGVKWSAAGPGSIDPETGLLTFTARGTVAVTATWGMVRNTIQVQGGPPTLHIEPSNPSVRPGQSITFQLLSDAGNGQTTPLTAQWAVISGDGTITPSGVFTAGTSGAVVQATYGGQTFTVTVEPDTSTLQISPASLSLVLGDQQQLTAQLVGPRGTRTVTPTWTVSPTTLGTVNSSGLFTASVVGKGTLTATYNGQSASVPITIAGPASMITVSLSTNSVTTNAKGTVTVTARVTDAFGTPTRSSVSQLFFSLGDPVLGTLSAYLVNVVDGEATATFTPNGTAGTQVIRVAAPPGTNLMAGSAALAIVPPQPGSIALTALPATLAADGRSQTDIIATLLDQSGQPLTNTGGTYAVQLTTDGNAAGMLLDQYILINNGESSGTARFQASSQPGTTVISGTSSLPVQPVHVSTVVVGPAAQLGVVLSSATAPADGSTAVTARVEVQDAAGHLETGDNTSAVSLVLTGPSGSSNLGTRTVRHGFATFTLTQAVAGTYTLVASLVGNASIAQGQASVTFTAGAAAKLQLTIDPPGGYLSADYATTAYLVAQVLDANNNPVPTPGIPITFTKLTKNGAIQTLSQTVANTDANGEARVPIRTTSVAGSERFQATSAGLADSDVLTVTTQRTGRAAAVKVQPVSPSNVVAGQPFTVRVYVVDSAGHLVTGGSGQTVTLTTTGNDVTTDSPQVTRYGVATFSVTAKQVGIVTITAQAQGLSADLTGTTVAVGAGPTDHIELRASASAIGADGVSTLTITPVPVDAGGNPTWQPFLVTLSLSDTTIGSLTSQVVSTGSSVTFRSSHTAGSVVVSGVASVPVVPLTLSTYVAGAPKSVVIDQVSPVVAGNSGASLITITARIVDANGHTITSLNSGSGGVSLVVLQVTQGVGPRISVSGGSNLLPPGMSIPDGHLSGSAAVVGGVATFTFSDTVAETVTLKPVAAVNGTLLAASPADVVVRPGPAVSVQLSASPTGASTTSSTKVTVTAWLQDAFGNRVPSDGDTFTFSLSPMSYLQARGGLTAISGPNGASITLYTLGRPGVTSISARSAATGLSAATPLTFTVDQPPATPAVAVSGATTAAVLSTDIAFKVTVTVSPRVSSQLLFVYLNGAQVPLYADTAGTKLLTAIPPNTGTVTGYVLRTNWGVSGAKSLWVVTQNGAGTSGVSNVVQFTLP